MGARTSAIARGALASTLVSVWACTGSIGDVPFGGSGPRSTTARGPSGVVLAPATGAMRRLTTVEYRNAISDVLGSAAVPDAALEVDETSALFESIGASHVATSARGVEQYREAALEVGAKAIEHRADIEELSTCAPASSTDPCIARAIERLGHRLWRRPLAPDEIARIAAIAGAAGDEPDALALGLRYALAALVAAPSFLYVSAVGEPDRATGWRRYSSAEMASRLALLLWASVPDEELLAAGERGELATREGVEEQTWRMLDAPRAGSLASRFFAESWMVAGLAVADKNTDRFPAWSAALLGAYRDELDRVLVDLVERDGDVRELFTSRSTFATSELAAAYGVDLGGATEPAAVPLPDTRRGLLTSGAVIAAFSPSDRTSPTQRGLFVRERVLCEALPPPPADVNTAAVDTAAADGTATLRERLERHRSDPVCASCHQMIDPIGFAFEHFDAIGLWRDEDDGLPIDSTGELDGTKVSSAAALAELLGKDPRSMHCVARRLYEFASGHEQTDGERPVVDEIARAFTGDGHSFRRLVVEVVTSDGFRFFVPDP